MLRLLLPQGLHFTRRMKNYTKVPPGSKELLHKQKGKSMEFLKMSAEEFRKYVTNEGNPHNQKKIANKYHAEKTKGAGRTFDSKKEYRRYCQLKAWQDQGIISGLETQKRFILVEKFTYRGLKMNAVSWIADFYYFNGQEWVAEDVKSPVTRKKAEYVIKKKLFMLKYPEILFNEFL